MNALIVVTSHDKLGATGDRTGWFLSEVSHVYWRLFNDGFEIDFASPKGGMAPLEMTSMRLDDPENKSFVEKHHIQDGISTIAIKDVDPAKYQVIYFAGGHGTMWDFPDNEDLQRVTSTIYENNGIVAAVCHGPAALTNIKLSDGRYLVDGKEINSFTDSEEREVKKDDVVPFLLETRLRERGGKFKSTKNWGEMVVVSDRLITGQNPQSAAALGKQIVKSFSIIEIDQMKRHQDESQEKRLR